MKTLELNHQKEEKERLINEATYLHSKWIYTKWILEWEIKEINAQYEEIVSKILWE